ncbi:hypothetical protein QH494_13345 [Sphingomonas sp. AR_OL41]|uniref:DUF6975 family protein n=1 Tax=Sphingomonas sp. AR_OL41 TaxID=3042729 RepID=UPI002480E1EF|nr:hypothetical protein [Sphingomonas sp. AR_OL41]MDH7973168.1 hypothetical protein [Sphingomonas sp. AR_OL41]
MAFESTQLRGIGTGWDVIAALAESDGNARHPHLLRLSLAGAAQRDLADAVHAICSVHGRTTDLFDEASRHRGGAPDAGRVAPAWVEVATEGFAAERAFLATLTAAAGPLPSTPGQAETDAALVAQRHAFDMLARSGRAGCATGAAIALVIDWYAFRDTMDVAAARFGVAPPKMALPDAIEIATIVATLSDSPMLQRAMAFGAQQVFAQHRGLWDLLEARASARDRH